MSKHHGYILLDEQGKPVCGPYGYVLLFNTVEIAKREALKGHEHALKVARGEIKEGESEDQG